MPRRHTPRAPKKKSNGCVGCLGGLLILGILGVINSAFDALNNTDDAQSKGTPPSSTADRCPGRIAEALPNGEGARLIEAFRTRNKQITLCSTSNGALYYYGEFSDHREKGIAMSARKTNNGYVARNAPYEYVIEGGVVTIYESNRRIGQEKVTPEPSPR